MSYIYMFVIEVKKDDKVTVARCPFCNSEDFELHDVDPNEKVWFSLRIK